MIDINNLESSYINVVFSEIFELILKYPILVENLKSNKTAVIKWSRHSESEWVKEINYPKRSLKSITPINYIDAVIKNKESLEIIGVITGRIKDNNLKIRKIEINPVFSIEVPRIALDFVLSIESFSRYFKLKQIVITRISENPSQLLEKIGYTASDPKGTTYKSYTLTKKLN